MEDTTKNTEILAAIPKGGKASFAYFHEGSLTLVPCVVQRQGSVLTCPTEPDLDGLSLPRDFWQVRVADDTGLFKKHDRILCLCIVDRSKLMRMHNATIPFPSSQTFDDGAVQIVSYTRPETILPEDRAELYLFYYESVEVKLYKALLYAEKTPPTLPKGNVLHSDTWGKRRQQKQAAEEFPETSAPHPSAEKARAGPASRKGEGKGEEVGSVTESQSRLSTQSISSVMHKLHSSSELASFPPGKRVNIIIGPMRESHLVSADIVVQGEIYETSSIQSAADRMTSFPFQFWQVRIVDSHGLKALPPGTNVNVFATKSRKAGAAGAGDGEEDTYSYTFTYYEDYELDVYRRTTGKNRMKYSQTLTQTQNKVGGRIKFSEPLVSSGAHCSDIAAAAMTKATTGKTARKTKCQDKCEEGCASDQAYIPSSKSVEDPKDSRPLSKVARKFTQAAKESASTGAGQVIMTASTAKAALDTDQPLGLPDCPFHRIHDHVGRCPLFDPSIGAALTDANIAPNPDFIQMVIKYFYKRPPQEIIRHFGVKIAVLYAAWIAGED